MTGGDALAAAHQRPEGSRDRAGEDQRQGDDAGGQDEAVDQRPPHRVLDLFARLHFQLLALQRQRIHNLIDLIRETLIPERLHAQHWRGYVSTTGHHRLEDGLVRLRELVPRAASGLERTVHVRVGSDAEGLAKLLADEVGELFNVPMQSPAAVCVGRDACLQGDGADLVEARPEQQQTLAKLSVVVEALVERAADPYGLDLRGEPPEEQPESRKHEGHERHKLVRDPQAQTDHRRGTNFRPTIRCPSAPSMKSMNCLASFDGGTGAARMSGRERTYAPERM